MSKYENLDKYLEKKGIKIKVKEKKKTKDLKSGDIEALTIKMLKDFGYLY